MSLRDCESAHCSGADAELNEICVKEGWPIDHPVLTRDSQGPCACKCSCFALNTPIFISEDEFKAVQDIKKGDYVYAAGLDLKWHRKKVTFSQGTEGRSKQPLTIYIAYGDDQHLIVTPDSLFLMEDKKLKRADKLTPEDYLINQNGEKVRIAGVVSGDFYGGFHHIATEIEVPSNDLQGHLIVANGIVCGDYMLQVYYQSKDFEGNQLTVGTKDYKEKYGTIEKINDEQFIPSYKQHITKPPSNARTFIPIERSKRYLEFGSFRSFNDSISRAWTEYLFELFQRFYPEINYTLDWEEELPNAYAWIDNGKRYIRVTGGLARSKDIEMEGLALAMAHEISHHYGGDPVYPDDGLSCEGQADFYASRNVMRKVWFGEYYITVMEKAIKQIAAFFAASFSKEDEDVGREVAFLPEGDEKNIISCDHPPDDCRIETFNAGVDLKPKPSCAE
ncbi:hypothetical protein [Priestia megaterium]|uniref:hypothetical protein n=1 Tax=Priestia megaterium TaxID=1404 RepID=UPI002FFF82CA